MGAEKILGGLELLAHARKRALGARAPEGAGLLEQRRVEAGRAPFEMAGRSPLKQIEVISSPRQNMPKGHALDLNALGDWDLAHYQPLERKRPTTVSNRAKAAYTNENVRDFERYVRRGSMEGGLEWYDMSPLSRVALQEMPPEEFKRLMAMNAATSARSSVQDQIKRASLAWYYKHQGIPWPMTNEKLAEIADPGYGHLAHDIHSKHLGPLVAGEEPGFSSMEQPKYASYYQNFLGNMAPLTADTHYQALHGFPMKMTYNKANKKWIEAPDFSKNVDYPFAENFSGERARRMGIPLPLYQAAAWVGGREATGVKDARPFAAVYDEIIKRTADQMDITPTDALKKHLRGQIPLLPIERAEGGLAMAGGGAPEALMKYIRHRLPKKYSSLPMQHLQDESQPALSAEEAGKRYLGSGRDIYSLGDDKLVKLAKRPRGLYEMSLEGDPRVERHLPQLHWRSPDNELAIVERMQHTPERSAELFEPMKNRYEEANYRSPIPSHRLHRDDPQLSKMMRRFGLEDFQPLDIHGPDFFMTPENHWSMARRGSLGRTPTLLDPGAMDHRITRPQFEQSWAPSFRDVLEERIRKIMPPKFRAQPHELISNAMKAGDLRALEPLGIGRGTEDFLGPGALWPVGDRPETTDEIAGAIRRLMPREPSARPDVGTFDEMPIQHPRFVTGNAEGGLIEHRLRALKMAGGGVPRNWLRGVKGSQIDKVLEDLKKRYAPEKHEDMLPGDEKIPGIASQLAREKHMRDWIDKNLGNYIVRDMGAPEDPLGPLLGHETGRALKKLRPADVPAHIVGDGPREPIELAYAYKNAGGKKKFEEAQLKEKGIYDEKMKSFVDQMPGWLRKHYEEDLPSKQLKPHLLPTNHLHDVDEGGWGSYMAGPMHDMLDWMRQSGIPPERLGRVSVPQAMKASQEWHAELARKAEEAKNAPLAIGPWLKEHKAYPTGFKWHQYDPESIPKSRLFGDRKEVLDSHEASSSAEQKLRDALKAEGEHMGHCVGDYCDSVLGGESQIFSLRDEKGRPHVTIEARPREGFTAATAEEGRYGPEMRNAAASWKKQYKRGEMDDPFPVFIEKNHPDLYKSYWDQKDIVQIKGKGNKKPVDEYLPYVQDFVRSGKWGDIGDYNNTGLRPILNRNNKKFHVTPQEADALEKLQGQHPVDPANLSATSTRYDIPDDWKPQGFAAGGMVMPAGLREAPDERLMRAQLQLQVLMEELQQPDYGPEEKVSIVREIHRIEQLIARLRGQTGVKDGAGSTSSPAAPELMAAAPEGEDDAQDPLHEETMDMLGRFVTGDPNGEDFLQQLLAEEEHLT